MPKEEIIGGIRNALDRGESEEKAIKSFIAAGYNEKEVRAAADMAKKPVQPGTASAIINPQTPKTSATSQKPIPITPPKKKKGKLFWIILIALILLVVGGAVAYLLIF